MSAECHGVYRSSGGLKGEGTVLAGNGSAYIVGRRNVAERQEAGAVDAAGASRSTWNGLRSAQGGAMTMHEGP